MPVTVPRRTEDLPPFEDYAMAGRTYRFATVAPLYPFGFGLGFGRTSYADPVLSSPILPAGGAISIQVTVTNHGALAAAEVVQCYVQPPRDWPEAPLASLAGFQKVQLLPGESRKVSFTLPASAFAQFNSMGEQVHAVGRYGLVVGTCSPGRRGQELGAPEPVRVELTLV
jgi:beta-glucosidase